MLLIPSLCVSLAFCCVVVDLTSAAPVVVLKELPKFIPVCKRNSDTFNECVMNATVAVRPYLPKGVPELRIPPLEPLTVPMVNLQQKTAVVTYNASLKNLNIHGLTDYSFSSIRADIDRGYLEGSLVLPRLRLQSDYTISGRVLRRSIVGSGVLTANITDTVAKVEVRGRVASHDGVVFFRVLDAALSLEVGAAMVLFQNLHEGDANTTMATNTFLNENSLALVREVVPAVEGVAAMVLKDALGKAFRVAPLHVLFPKDA